MKERCVDVEEFVEDRIDELLEFYGLEDLFDLTTAELVPEIRDTEDMILSERRRNGDAIEYYEAYLSRLHVLLDNAVE